MIKVISTGLAILLLVGGLFIGTRHLGLSVQVDRIVTTNKQTIGTIHIKNWLGMEVFHAKTLEVPSCIHLLHDGKYKLFLRMHHNQYKCYGIYEKPLTNGLNLLPSGFINQGRGFEIHIANTVHDLKGCIGVGAHFKNNTDGSVELIDSKFAFEQFMKVLDGKTEIPLVIVDAKYKM